MGKKKKYATKNFQIKQLAKEILRLQAVNGERWDSICELEQEVTEYEEVVRKLKEEVGLLKNELAKTDTCLREYMLVGTVENFATLKAENEQLRQTCRGRSVTIEQLKNENTKLRVQEAEARVEALRDAHAAIGSLIEIEEGR